MAAMSKDRAREERLAAQLRENLRRRKAQARGLAAGSAARADDDSATPEPPLSKPGEGR
jgi:hypothetical protein